MCAGCEQSHTNDTLVKYVYKYMSKPQQQHCHRVLCSGLHNCPVMWHAQACMLLRALPLDVVHVICAHVCERAAIALQKWSRGFIVRHAPGLCDSDGNLVYL